MQSILAATAVTLLAVATADADVGTPIRFSALAAGQAHTCGLEAETGKAWCWGANPNGQLGNGTHFGQRSDVDQQGEDIPQAVAGHRAYSSISAYDDTTCAIESETGWLWCWGVIRPTSTWDRYIKDQPVRMDDKTPLDSVVVGRGIICGVAKYTSVAMCLDVAPPPPHVFDGPVRRYLKSMLPGVRMTSLHAGEERVCGIALSTEVIHCWGRNLQLARPDTISLGTLFPRIQRGVNSLAIGRQQHCALVSLSARVVCLTKDAPEQTLTELSGDLRFTGLSQGMNAYSTCGVEQESGFAWCWGTDMQSHRLATTPRFTSLVLGSSHGCGLETGTGLAWCWGRNESGQLGSGNTDFSCRTTIAGRTGPDGKPCQPKFSLPEPVVGPERSVRGPEAPQGQPSSSPTPIEHDGSD